MAKRLIKNSIAIKHFISSPAKRAKKTAKIFMEEFGEKEKQLLLEPSLYEGTIKDFYKIIENLDDEKKHVAVFAHNPGITEFANSLECSPIYNMPTCGVFALTIKTKHWKEFREAEKTFLFFDYPKNEE